MEDRISDTQVFIIIGVAIVLTIAIAIIGYNNCWWGDDVSCTVKELNDMADDMWQKQWEREHRGEIEYRRRMERALDD